MKNNTTTHISDRPSIVVIGAGVAGLAAGYLLRETGRKRGFDPQLTVLEALARPGGATRTDRLSGYTCEWGPNGFLDNEPASLALIEQLGISSSLVSSNSRANRRFIYHHGRMRELPLSPPAFLKSDILPLHAKLRLAMEIFIPPLRKDIDETVDSFGRRRLGGRFATYLLDPMVSGIFAGNSQTLSLAAVFPKMAEMEKTYGGLFRAMFAKKRQARRSGKNAGGPAGPGGKLLTFKTGMGCLTTTLAAKLEDSIITSTGALSLQAEAGRYVVVTAKGRYPADAVILACPSYAAADIISELAPDAATAAGDIPFAPVSVVCHGHPAAGLNHSLDGFGVLIPRVEGIRSLGCLWSDSIFPGQAPPEHKLLRTMIGGAHDPGIMDHSEQELHSIAHRDHDRLFGVQAEPVFKHQYIHPRGIAQYTRGHLTRINKLDQLERELPGLFVTGASYRGVSVNGCVKDAFRINNLFWEKWRR